MGNDFCTGTRKPRTVAFTEPEQIQLKKLFNELTGAKRAKGKKRFNKNTLNSLFPENPHLSSALHGFMEAHAKAESLDEITFDIFEASLETLMKEPSDFQYRQYKDREKIDMLAILAIGKFTTERIDFQSLDITYVDALVFVKTILRTFQYQEKAPQRVDESTAKSVVDGAFHGHEGKIDWWTFLHYIKENLIYVNRCIKLYFSAKFLNKTVDLQIPELNGRSFILNKDISALLYMSNISFHSINQLQPLYSINYQDFSFEYLSKILTSYDGPTLLLFKVTPASFINRAEEKSFIIGAFSRMTWKDNGQFNGDSHNYLFSLGPKFKNFFASTSKTSNNHYMLLNSSSTKGINDKIGLGFGGTLDNDFRLFVNGENLSNSYIHNEDNTYELGSLIDSKEANIRVDYLEIWGLGAEVSTIQDVPFLRKYEKKPVLESGAETITTTKVTEIKEDSIQFNETRKFIEEKISELAKSRASYRSEIEEGEKRSAPAGYEKYLNLDELTRSPEEKAKRSAQRYSHASSTSPIKPRTSQTQTYGYYNPFSNEEMNLKVAKEEE